MFFSRVYFCTLFCYNKTMRTFIAINLPKSAKKQIQTSAVKIQKNIEAGATGNIVWVKPDALHLTVKFCGDIAPDNINTLRGILQSVTPRFRTFDITLTAITLFPKNRPRIVMAAVRENNVLARLVQEVSKRIDASGIIDKKFYGFKPPHLTLARIKGRWEGNFSEAAFGSSFPAAALDIMESQLQPHGPAYTLIDSFLLKT